MKNQRCVQMVLSRSHQTMLFVAKLKFIKPTQMTPSSPSHQTILLVLMEEKEKAKKQVSAYAK